MRENRLINQLRKFIQQIFDFFQGVTLVELAVNIFSIKASFGRQRCNNLVVYFIKSRCVKVISELEVGKKITA